MLTNELNFLDYVPIINENGATIMVKKVKKAKVKRNKQRGFYIGFKYKGKRLYFSTFYGLPVKDNLQLAEALADSINTDITKGEFSPEKYKQSKPLSLSNYYEKWIALNEPNLASATAHDYKESFKHILPILGNKFLPDIQP